MKIDINKAKKSCLDYYDKLHVDYHNDYSDELIKKPYDKDFLTRFAALIRYNGLVLDIGCCSSAQQARFLRDKGFEVTAIDLSENCIETAKKHFTDIQFIKMDMLEMDFENESYDALNAFYSIIHITDESLNDLFNDFNRILKMHGMIAITVHTGDFYGFYDENEFPVFYRTYTQRELKDLLTKFGFKIIEMEQRQPIYDFEFQSERIYIIAEKIISNENLNFKKDKKQKV